MSGKMVHPDSSSIVKAQPVSCFLSPSLIPYVSDPGTGQFYGVFPGGPSENVLSAYFQNQLPLWLNHNYYNMTDQRTVFVIEYT